MNLFYHFTRILLLALLLLPGLILPVSAAPTQLTLDDCVSLAFQNNPVMKIAQSDRNKSYWSLKQARAAKGFSIDYTYSAQRYDTPPSSSFSIYTWSNLYKNTVALSLPLYSGGKLESQIDQAKLSLKVSDLSLTATGQQLKQDVTNDYFNVLQYQNTRRVYQETVDNYAAHLKIVQAQFDAGMVAKSDVLSTAVSMADSQNDLLVVENSYDMALATLSNAIGLSLDTELNLADHFPFEKFTLSLKECTQYALSNRPEIAKYQTKIKIAQDDVKIARSGYLPTVSLSAAQYWSDDQMPGNQNPYWQVAMTTSWNVFDSGQTKAKLRQAGYSLDSAKEQARQQSDTVELEVRQYYHSMEEAVKRMSTSQVAIDQAEESLRIAEIRYKSRRGN